MSFSAVRALADEHDVAFIDLRFTDLLGQQHHITYPRDVLDESLLTDGRAFDGSSLPGWKGVDQSDMVLLPDPGSAWIDPLLQVPTLVMHCDVIEPETLQPYGRDPRALARRVEAFLRSTGIADAALFGPEPEFFVFDTVQWRNDAHHTSFQVNGGERGTMQGDAQRSGCYPLSPADSLHGLRSRMSMALMQAGQRVELHHAEVAGSQCEIGVRFNTLLAKADELAALKYMVRAIAAAEGKTATFMPKPLVGHPGSGMHVHQSLQRDGVNLFAGEEYGGLSQMALHYIGGIFRHARAINAFSNASTNSYKRLVPHFEAPVLLAYSANNRSASCRIPHVAHAQARRVEIRFPDALNSGYLTFAALLMAGIDGIINQIEPGAPMDRDLYELTPQERRDVATVSPSLEDALQALDTDRAFLTAGGVFSDDLIEAYITLKMGEVERLHTATHPLEYQMYYAG